MTDQTIPNPLRYSDFTVEKTRWARLPFGLRMTIGAAVIILPLGGAVASVSVLVSHEETADRSPARQSTIAQPAAGAAAAVPPGSVRPTAGRTDPAHATGLGARIGDDAATSRTATDGNLYTGLPDVPAINTGIQAGGSTGGGTAPTVVVTTRVVTDTREIPYPTQKVRDPSLPRHQREVRTPGETGLRTLTYEVTTTGGRETGRRLISAEVTREPVARVVAVGTRRPGCASEPEPGPEASPEPASGSAPEHGCAPDENVSR